MVDASLRSHFLKVSFSQGLTLLRSHLGFGHNSTLVLPQGLAGDAIFVDDAPKFIKVAPRVEERQVGLADDDVVWSIRDSVSSVGISRPLL